MNKLRAVVVVLPLVFTSLACPTRPIQPNKDGGLGGNAGATAGQTGTGGIGGLAGASVGGASGAPFGEAGGRATGGMNAGGAGGVAGAPGSGGASGVSGTAGIGGASGAGGGGGNSSGGGPGGAEVTGGGGSAKTADGDACSSNVVCESENCSTYSASGTSICCPTGNSNCGGCVDEKTDDTNCGACGTKCAANRSCQSGACACEGYNLPSSCGGCGSWSFESGTAEGWAKDTDPSAPISGGGTNGASNFVATTSQKHDGSYALAVPILVDRSTTYVGSTAVSLCTSGSTISVGGYTMSAWIMVHNGAGNTLGALDYLWFSAWGPSGGDHEPVVFGGIVTDTWFQVSFTFTTAIPVDHLGIYIAPGGGWQGTLYIDSVTLTGP